MVTPNSETNSLQGIVVLIPHFTEGNSYILELGKSYQAIGAQVIYGRDNLFQCSVKVQIIHINWPESIYRWAVSGSPEKKAQEMLAALGEFKKKGTKIIWTVHNLYPHEHKDDLLDISVYQRVIELSDLIVHRCSESIKLLKKTYQVPGSISNIICYGENSENIPNDVSALRARERLKIASDSFVFLQFGYIRQYKGVFHIIRAFWSVSLRKKILVIAGSYQAASSRWAVFDLILLKIISKFDRRIKVETRWVDDTEIQYYMNASNCIVLGNLSGLNSGVVGLAMRFGKLVVGPKIGCIPDRLGQGENLIYENQSQLIQAMQQAGTMDLEQIAKKNIYASSNWSWSKMINQILDGLFVPAKNEFNSLL